MGLWSYSTNASENTVVGAANIAEGGPAKNINNAIRGFVADIAKLLKDQGGALTTAGTGDAFTVTANTAPTAYSDGMQFAFVADRANTGAATLNVSAVGAKAIRKVQSGSSDAALTANDILQNGHYIVQYDASANSAAGAWILLNPSPVNIASSNVNITGGSITGISEINVISNRQRWISPADYDAYADGTDVTAKFNSALAAGHWLAIPENATGYLLSDGGLIIPSGAVIRGEGPNSILKIGSTSLNALLDLQTNSNITLESLWLKGNKATTTSNTSASSGVRTSPNASRLKLHGLRITDFTRHGIVLDGVTDAEVDGCEIDGTHRGAGVLCSATAISSNIRVNNNTIRNTAQGNIHAFFGVRQWRVTQNLCDTTGVGAPGNDGTAVADNITSYVENATGALENAVISDNICLNSGNHGIHVGGDGITIKGNRVKNPTAGGIFCAKGPNATPDPSKEYVVADNVVAFANRTNANAQGLNLRNLSNFTATGNEITDAHDGIQLNGLDTAGAGLHTGVVGGNTVVGYNRYGVWLRNKVKGTAVFGNRLDANVASTTVDIREDLVSAVSNDNFIFWNPSTGADTRMAQMLKPVDGNNVQLFGNEHGEHVRIGSSTANVVNGIQLQGNASGSPPLIVTRGSDANIDLYLAPKNSGVLRFGTHSAIGAETVTGFITIKDAGGTSRKLAVVS